MVTKGTSRQSSRCAMVAGLAASASFSVSRRKTCGMPWAWMAMRLTARSLASEPSFSTTRPVGRPKRPARVVSTATRSPSCASPLAPSGISNSLPSIFLSTGSSRPPPRGASRKMPSTRCFGLSMMRMTRPRWRMPASSSVSSTRSSTRSPRPAASPGRAWRGTWMRIFGAAPCASSSHSSGVAMRSPSAIARDDVGEHGRGQGARMMQLLVAFLDARLRRQARAAGASSRRAARSSGRRRGRSRGCRPCRAVCR